LCLTIVLAFTAIASAAKLSLSTDDLSDSRIPLPLPKAVRDNWHLVKIEEDSERIVGGTTTPSGGRKFQIVLLRSGSFTCGGSLIAPTKVLTAAHCVYGVETSGAFSIRYDTLVRTSGKTIAVSRVSRHGSYNSNTIDYDVAVLTLASAFAAGTNAAVIELASSLPANGAALTVSGWGQTSGSAGSSTNLLQVTMNHITTTDCGSRFGTSITARMICVFATGKSGCMGDSGGPLTTTTTGGQQVGVVSWGSGSCSGTPTVFASVPNLRAWILQQ